MRFEGEISINAVFAHSGHGDRGLVADLTIDAIGSGFPAQLGVVERVGLAGLVLELGEVGGVLVDGDGGGAKTGGGSVGGDAGQVSIGFGAEGFGLLDPADALCVDGNGADKDEEGSEDGGDPDSIDG